MRIRYTRRATRHLAALRRFSTDRFGATITDKTLTRIRNAIDDLAHRPRRGRPGRITDSRELVIPGLPFVVAYRITETSIDILAIIHAAQHWPQELD